MLSLEKKEVVYLSGVAGYRYLIRYSFNHSRSFDFPHEEN